MGDSWFIDNLWWIMIIVGFVILAFVLIFTGGSAGAISKNFRELAKIVLCFIPKSLQKCFEDCDSSFFRDVLDSCRRRQKRRQREKKEKKRIQNQKKNEIKEKKKQNEKAIKENKEITNELSRKSVINWKNKHFLSLLSQLGFPDQYFSKLSLYSGEMILSDEYFSDSFENMNNINNIFGNNQELVQRFLSVLRFLRFYPTKTVPKEFLSLISVEEFFQKNGLDANIPKIRSKQLHFAFIMEMTPQELNNVFEENNIHFGKILRSYLRKYRNEQHVSKKYDSYINTVVSNLTEQSFQTVKYVINGELDKLNSIGRIDLIDPMNIPPIDNVSTPMEQQPPISDFQNSFIQPKFGQSKGMNELY